jgi:murein DD-endopeptidase MepM/ murein hydrolase activator NlpD
MIGGLIILTVAAGATAAIVLARKQAIAEEFFAAGGTLPTPSKSPRRRQRFWQPVMAGFQGKAAAIVDAGRRSRGMNMQRVTDAGQRVPHWGVDILARQGTPVRAAKTGVVRRAEPISGYGNAVIIEHAGDGSVTLYGHLHDMAVGANDRVEGGQVIGHVGRTTAGPDGVVPSWGRTMGAHLHMEAHQSYPPDLRGGAQSHLRQGVVDPEEWLRGQGIAPYANYA